MVDKLQQHPHRQDDTLLRLAHGVNTQIVAAGNVMEHHFPLEAADNLLSGLRRLILQQLDHLCLSQRSILRQPVDDILFFLQ